mmetsp:Transcript_19122/g.28320  ORF Transcript_19122/g.28320 Transcript_19122/m.28320 type:complete len:130 (-) Transcript_19122:415-804(-)
MTSGNMTYMRKAGLTFLAMVLCFAIFANFGMNAVLQSIQILPEQGNKKDDEQYLLNGRATYLEAAKSLNPVTDKVTGHTYEIMYGKFLLPYYHRKPNMKMLEIGLGCDMGYGPGASVALCGKQNSMGSA